tara:strand:- start:16885 stop:17172 length:288 start_codon:yes stop_codon:yes gene_type:complete
MSKLEHCIKLVKNNIDWDDVFKVADDMEFCIGTLEQQANRLTDDQINDIFAKDSLLVAYSHAVEYLYTFLQLLKEADAKRYEEPIPYKHPKGAVI